jgi:hypothetical protein
MISRSGSQISQSFKIFKDVTPFGTGKIVLSIGMGIVALLSIPLGYWNLDDNIIVQNVALMVIILSLGAQGRFEALEDHIRSRPTNEEQRSSHVPDETALTSVDN